MNLFANYVFVRDFRMFLMPKKTLPTDWFSAGKQALLTHTRIGYEHSL